MNNIFLHTALGRFRAVAFLEGISFLLLLFIAMPLKYYAGYPLMVKYTGWAHGVLFVLYIATLLQATLAHKWSFLKMVLAFVASLLPFGTFVLDVRLAREIKSSKEKATA